MRVLGKVGYFSPPDKASRDYRLICKRCSTKLDYNNAIYRHYNPFTGEELSTPWTLCETCSRSATMLGHESLRMCRDATLFSKRLQEEWFSKTDK